MPLTRRAGLGLSVLTVVLVGLPFVGVAVLLTTQASWLPWLAAAGVPQSLAFVAAATLLCGLACLPAQVAAVVAGFVFGFGPGALLALAGVGGAAGLGYVVLRAVSGHRWRAVIGRWSRLGAVHAALLTGGRRTTATVVGLLRLAPIMPFSGTNLWMAAARVPFLPFLLGTLLGFAPLALLAASAGAMLAELRLDGEARPATWLTLVGLVVSVGGLGWLARRRLVE